MARMVGLRRSLSPRSLAEQSRRCPQDRTETTYISPATTGTVTGSGSYTDASSRVDFLGSEPVEVLGKAIVDAGGGPPLGDTSTFGGRVTLNTSAMSARICFSINGVVLVRNTESTGASESRTPVLASLLPGLFDSLDGLLTCLELPLQADYTIPSGRRVWAEGPSSVVLEWSDFVPDSPPDEGTKG